MADIYIKVTGSFFMPFPEFPPAFVLLRNQIRGNRSQYIRTRMPLKIVCRWHRECSPRTCHWKCTENSEKRLSVLRIRNGYGSQIRICPSQIPGKKTPNPRSGSAIKNFCIFYAKNCYRALGNTIRDFSPRSQIPVPDFFYPGARIRPIFFSTAGKIITSSSVPDPD